MERHIIWERGRRGGRLQVSWAEGDQFARAPIVLRRVQGDCPAASDLFWLLEAVLPEGWRRLLPCYPWRVERKVSSAGAEFQVRVLIDAEPPGLETSATIRVSGRRLLEWEVEAPVWALAAITKSQRKWFQGEPDFDRLLIVSPEWQQEAV